jgi:thiamine kinase-like enzyme
MGIVMCHNNIKASNMLMSLDDNTKFTIIDYKLADYNPAGYDIACYVNNCMLDTFSCE